jgi:hypothetical protein
MNRKRHWKVESMPSSFQRRNPFHPLLLATGAAFALAACSYCVMILKQRAAGAEWQSSLAADPWLAWMDRHGGALLVTALAMLAAVALADFLWETLHASRHDDSIVNNTARSGNEQEGKQR